MHTQSPSHPVTPSPSYPQHPFTHTVALALVGEVSEVAEIFQWRPDAHCPPGLDTPTWTDADRQHLGEEISDVLLYLVRLADVTGVDLGRAVASKMVKNAAKYPAEVVKGKSDKYTAYHTP